MGEDTKRPKRFYKTVSVDAQNGFYEITLDGRVSRTQGRRALATPYRALSYAIAHEWDSQVDYIDRHLMKLTVLLSITLDADERQQQEWCDEIINYLNTDLLCYRAEKPSSLVSRQHQEWNPFLDWLKARFDVALGVSIGLSAIQQPEDATKTIQRYLAELSAEQVLACITATKITGSAVLGLALLESDFTAEVIFSSARLDETYQSEQWGVDAEAEAREARMKEDFLAVAQFLELIRS